MFAYNKEITLESYIQKRKRNVLLASSLHHDDKMDSETENPEIISDYNHIKDGVDTVVKCVLGINVQEIHAGCLYLLSLTKCCWR